MSWGGRRQAIYASVIIGAFLIVTGIPLFLLYYEPATCFDGSHNGTEVGVDCGGACQQVCEIEVAPLVTKWSRAFEVTSGNYSAVAYIENPNTDAGIKSIGYRFELFDEDNSFIAEREGQTFIIPGSISPVFESGINTGERTPARTFFEFTQEAEWFRARPTRDRLTVSNRSLSGTDKKPRLDATLNNQSSVDEFSDIETVAVIFGTDGNAIAASRTLVPRLSPRESKDIVFTWPEPFETRFEQCTAPADVVLLMDTSGSMNDDGDSPPQPITDAKNSARAFVDRLTSSDRIGIISFATNAILNHPVSSQHDRVQSAIQNLSILPEEEQGSTNIGDAISRATEELSNLPPRDTSARVQSVIVLLTDGRANAPLTPGGEVFAQVKAGEAKGENIVLYTIGLGDRVNDEFLSSIASDPGNYFQAATSKDLDGIYAAIGESICERGPAVIDIIPLTREVFE